MTLVFLLEDASMKALLEGLLPRLLPIDVSYRLVPHEGKADLDASVPRKVQAWQDPSARFIVLRDQDSGDCRAIKQRIRERCSAVSPRPITIRIACRELESWYLADLTAVDAAFGSKLAHRQQQTMFRDPDRIGSPSRELEKLVPSFGKVKGARLLGPHLDLTNARSLSFFHFVSVVRRLAASPSGAGT